MQEPRFPEANDTPQATDGASQEGIVGRDASIGHRSETAPALQPLRKNGLEQSEDPVALTDSESGPTADTSLFSAQAPLDSTKPAMPAGKCPSWTLG